MVVGHLVVAFPSATYKFFHLIFKVSCNDGQEKCLVPLRVHQAHRVGVDWTWSLLAKKGNNKEKEEWSSVRKIKVASIASKNVQVTDASLHPTTGELRCRMNRNIQHYPEESKRRARCQLHKWSRNEKGKEVFASVVRCSICQVGLCIDCFRLFHEEADLISIKGKIAGS